MSAVDAVAPVTVESPGTPLKHTWRRRGLILFWVWYVLAGLVWFAGGLANGGLAKAAWGMWPFSMGIVWWLTLKYREPLQRFAKALPAPFFVKFMFIGLFFTDILMENVAISFRGDLHPNLALNTLLWVGFYAGVLLAWWNLTRLHAFTAWQVLFIYGFKGILVEQSFMVPKAVMSGNIAVFLIGAPLLTVVYGASVAPVFVALEKEMPRPGGRSAWLASAPSMLLSAAAVFLPGAGGLRGLAIATLALLLVALSLPEGRARRLRFATVVALGVMLPLLLCFEVAQLWFLAMGLLGVTPAAG